MYCENCGSKTRQETRFCSKCGQRVMRASINEKGKINSVRIDEKNIKSKNLFKKDLGNRWLLFIGFLVYVVVSGVFDKFVGGMVGLAVSASAEISGIAIVALSVFRLVKGSIVERLLKLIFFLIILLLVFVSIRKILFMDS